MKSSNTPEWGVMQTGEGTVWADESIIRASKHF